MKLFGVLLKVSPLSSSNDCLNIFSTGSNKVEPWGHGHTPRAPALWGARRALWPFQKAPLSRNLFCPPKTEGFQPGFQLVSLEVNPYSYVRY